MRSERGKVQVYKEIDAANSGMSATVLYYHDSNENLIREIDPTGSNTTFFGYNADNQVTWTMNAMSSTAAMQYDPSGNLTSETDGDGRLQTFTYDALGRETSNVWFAGPTTALPTETISFG